MKEYIEKAALLENLNHAGILSRFVKFKIERFPAADVAEVRHGRWDTSGRYKFLDGRIAIRYTECGAALHLDEYQKYHWHYCPNCGALMREDEHEAN